MSFFQKNLFYHFIHTLFLFLPIYIFSQTSSISGVVNHYTQVNTVDYANNTVTVSDPTHFSIGDTVLLIQIQGANISETNNSNYGNVSSLQTTGAYELLIVCAVLGNNVSFLYQMVNAYDLQNGARLQMVSVPQYQNAIVSDTLKASPWNGQTGGVAIIQVRDRLTLNAPIDLSGMGFRGGNDSSLTSNCNAFFAENDYAYTSYTESAAMKGEGIASFTVGMEAGRGKQANGGGGGNDHNTGGGGGSNYGLGGIGGRRGSTSLFECKGNFPGIGGLSLSGLGYSGGNNRAFMGGGGGAGHSNNDQSSDGGNGGGILILIADTLDGNGFSIYNNGLSGENSSSDGAPGGGAGGSILLSVDHFMPQALNLQANGGNGGGANYIIGLNCEGPGGGGGGGVIWSKTDISGLPSLSIQTVGGSNGISDPLSTECPGATNDAASGGNGALLSGLTIPMETVTQNSCILQQAHLTLEWATEFSSSTLSWTTLNITDQDYFEIEGRDEYGVFYSIHRQESTSSLSYHRQLSSNHLTRFKAYRVKQVSIEGDITYSNIVSHTAPIAFQVDIHPNPLPKGSSAQLNLYIPRGGKVALSIFDSSGRIVSQNIKFFESGSHRTRIPSSIQLSPGFYLFKVKYEGYSYLKKMVIR